MSLRFCVFLLAAGGKVYQVASMFLVYGVLDVNKLGTQDTAHYTKESHGSSKRENGHPTVSFLAHPLVEMSEFLQQTLLNSRSMEQLKRDLEDDEEADLPPHKDTIEQVHYEDAIVDNIMNGCGEGDESGYGSEKATVPSMNIDEGTWRRHYLDNSFGKSRELSFVQP